MQHKTLIFINNQTLKAINVNEDDTYDFISIDGNSSMKYSNKNHIDDFLEYVREYYNISNFADIKISILIVNCNAEEEYVERLHSAFKGTVKNDIMNICTVLPLVAGLKKKLNKEGSTLLEVMDEHYRIEQDSEGHLICCHNEESNEGIKFAAENFVVLYNFDINLLNDNEKELKMLGEKDEQLKRYRDKLKCIKSDLEKINAENDALKTKLTEVSKEYAELYDRFNKRNRSRVVCRLPEKYISEKKVVTNDVYRQMEAAANKSTVIKYVIHGGAVTKGQLICKVLFLGWNLNFHKNAQSPISIETYELRAVQNGRVFYIYNENRGVARTSKVLIIGDIDDTEKTVMDWYNKTYKK